MLKIQLLILQGGPGVQDAHYSIMELAERLGALGAGPAAVGAAAAASRGMLSCYIIMFTAK